VSTSDIIKPLTHRVERLITMMKSKMAAATILIFTLMAITRSLVHIFAQNLHNKIAENCLSVWLYVCLLVCLSQTSILNLHSAEGAAVGHDATNFAKDESLLSRPTGRYTCYNRTV